MLDLIVTKQRIEKPHAVCIPYPAQGHITPMIQLAKLLHRNGFHITFVNTDYNHQRLIRARGTDAVQGVEGFSFKSIPDGLPRSTHPDRTQDIPALCETIGNHNLLQPFRELVRKLNQSVEEDPNPPVSCIVADGGMSFTQEVAEQLGVPVVYLWTTSAAGFWSYFHYLDLIERGYTPFKEESQLTNGYLETKVDWIEGMPDVELKYLPSFIRTLDRDDVMLNFCSNQSQAMVKGSAFLINTFEELELPIVEAIRRRIPRLFTVGPLLTLCSSMPMEGLTAINSSLWPEEAGCLDWLNRQEEGSVVYLNFGSITVMTPQQMVEFAWGLANSNHPFLWVIRPDLVEGKAAMVPKEFLAETRNRRFLASWCPQKDVLNHPSVALFLTHSGWNSTLENICAGVPMLCWPFFAEQLTNCRYVCQDWGIGMEIDGNVKRDQIEGQVREMLAGEKGREMRRKAREWKEASEKAVSSPSDFHRLLDQVLLQKVA